jgi:acylpyruvate hydrolase
LYSNNKTTPGGIDVRFMAFQHDVQAGLAVETSPGLFHGLLESAPDYPGSLDDILARGGDGMARAADLLARGDTVDPAQARYAPPLRHSRRIICIGLNYRAHAEESGHPIPDYPTLFARFPDSLIAHQAPLVRPRVSRLLDYEGEFAAIIGAPARHVPVASALDHVAGYSVFNDGSIRDYQMRTPQWTVGKNFDGTGAFGPYFVTADALPPGADGLRLMTRVNGLTVQDTSTSDLIFDVATLVSLLSEVFTLYPGDVIVTGTPSGVGGLRQPPLFLKPGDICEIEVEGIGLLSNGVVDEPG